MSLLTVMEYQQPWDAYVYGAGGESSVLANTS